MNVGCEQVHTSVLTMWQHGAERIPAPLIHIASYSYYAELQHRFSSHDEKPTTGMRLLGSIPKGLFLSIAILVIHIYAATAKQPLILDSDHGYFIDDIFAMACLPMTPT